MALKPRVCLKTMRTRLEENRLLGTSEWPETSIGEGQISKTGTSQRRYTAKLHLSPIVILKGLLRLGGFRSFTDLPLSLEALFPNILFHHPATCEHQVSHFLLEILHVQGIFGTVLSSEDKLPFEDSEYGQQCLHVSLVDFEFSEWLNRVRKQKHFIQNKARPDPFPSQGALVKLIHRLPQSFWSSTHRSHQCFLCKLVEVFRHSDRDTSVDQGHGGLLMLKILMSKYSKGSKVPSEAPFLCFLEATSLPGRF